MGRPLNRPLRAETAPFEDDGGLAALDCFERTEGLESFSALSRSRDARVPPSNVDGWGVPGSNPCFPIEIMRSRSPLSSGPEPLYVLL
jgi:hypothetical protein